MSAILPCGTFRLVMFGLIVLLIVSGIAVWTMLDIPLGPTFDTALHLALCSLILLLLLSGVRQFGTRRIWRKIVGGFLALIGLVLALLLVILHVDYTVLPVFDINPEVSKAAWHEDLNYLARELPDRHPGLFSMIPEAEFRREVRSLDQRIDSLDDGAIRAAMARLVALPDDGHTFPNIFSLNLHWHLYPLGIHFFDDQLVIVEADREHQDLIGSRITRIGGQPLAAVLDTMEVFLSNESPPMRLERLCNALCVAEWLHAAGVATRPDQVEFTLADHDGGPSTVTLSAVHYLPCIAWMMSSKVDDSITSIAIKGERQTNYRFEYLPDSETLYFQFNLTTEEGQDETLTAFINRLRAFVETQDFERCVIDVRNNDGGDGGLLPTLVEFLAESGKINREGRLFVLTSRRTYSAAAMFTSMMQNNTTAVIIGEATAQGPLFYSSPVVMKLPNSRMEFLVSSRRTTAGLDCDVRRSIEPDVPVAFTRQDHFSGADPCLRAAIEYVPPVHERKPVSAEVITRVAGRYRFSPLQVLSVENDGGDLRLKVSDFLAGSTRGVNTRLHQTSATRLQSDISGVEVHLSPGTDPVSSLTLVWRDATIDIPRMPIEYRLPLELFQAGQIEEGIQGLLAEKDLYIEQVPNLEVMLNQAGYDYLREERIELAITVFKVNVKFFPSSWNVHDSLGEAYLAAGQPEHAAASYRRSLELNPESASAISALGHLE